MPKVDYGPRRYWTLTGKLRHRHHWVWYGWVNFRLRLVLEVEEEKDLYKPLTTLHSPANWVAKRRWRPAETTDLSHLLVDHGISVGINNRGGFYREGS